MRKSPYYIIAAVLFLAMAYAVAIFFFPPAVRVLHENERESGQECVPGEMKPCVTDAGCAGWMPCRLGELGECVPDYECIPGEVESCPFNVCTAGSRTCGLCGKWGPCNAPAGCDESCTANTTS